MSDELQTQEATKTPQRSRPMSVHVFQILMLTVIGGLVALGTYDSWKPLPDSPPPGWKIVCDNRGHYGWQTPSGFINEEDGGSPMTSWNQANRDAWSFYEYQQRALKNPRKPLDVGPWQVCEGEE